MKRIFTSILLASFLFTVQLFPVLAQQSQNTLQQTIPECITFIFSLRAAVIYWNLEVPDYLVTKSKTT